LAPFIFAKNKLECFGFLEALILGSFRTEKVAALLHGNSLFTDVIEP
jgi:hypothetical protein